MSRKILFFLRYFYEHWFFWSIIILLTIKSLTVNALIGTFYFHWILFVWTLLMLTFLFLPFIFFKKNHRYALILDVVITFILVATLWYHRYFMGIPSLGSLLFAKQLVSISDSVLTVIKPLDLLFFSDLLLILFFMKLKKNKRLTFSFKDINLKYNLVIMIIFILGLGGLIYQDREDHLKRFLNNVYDTKIITERYGILGAYYVDLYKNVASSLKKLSPEKREETLTEAKRYNFKETSNDFSGSAKGKNVIMIQAESFAAGVVGRTVNGQEITPFTNKFLKESDYFSNNYYAYGLGNTSDIDFSTNTSIYPLVDSSVFIKYGKNPFTSLPRVMTENGYSAHAYHGYAGDFWNRFISYNSLGYQQFFSSGDYPKYEKINMGINDDDFLQKTAEYIEKQPKPSFSYVVTLSTHTSFNLPEDKKELNLQNLDIPEYSQKYLQNIHYSDKALGHFMETLKTKGLYEDSLIVLYGDHMPKIESYRDDQGLVDYGYDLHKKVPLMIKRPNQKNSSVNDSVTKNLDIMPTILNMVGFKTDYPVFGRDLYSKEAGYFSSILGYSNQFTLDNNYIYRNESDQPECVSRKSNSPVKIESCDYLASRLVKERDLSENLIKFNLLKELIAK